CADQLVTPIVVPMLPAGVLGRLPDLQVRSPRDRRSVTLLVRFVACAALVGAAACGTDDPPENPTWSDVQPILRAECGSCHASTAAVTGMGYRFDFYDMSSDPCGDAGAVLANVSLARGQKENIAKAITSTDPDVRPIMPPLPAPYLTDNEWM